MINLLINQIKESPIKLSKFSISQCHGMHATTDIVVLLLDDSIQIITDIIIYGILFENGIAQFRSRDTQYYLNY